LHHLLVYFWFRRIKRMARDYGRLGSNRRSGAAVWQWLIIGLVFGLGCSLMVFLGLLIAGFVGIDPTGAGLIGSTQTAVVQIVTATTDPNQPTQAPLIITATEEERPTQESAIIVPSATIPVVETATSTTDPAVTPPTATTAGTVNTVDASGQTTPNTVGVPPA
jgi:hypothetical protein